MRSPRVGENPPRAAGDGRIDIGVAGGVFSKAKMPLRFWGRNFMVLGNSCPSIAHFGSRKIRRSARDAEDRPGRRHPGRAARDRHGRSRARPSMASSGRPHGVPEYALPIPGLARGARYNSSVPPGMRGQPVRLVSGPAQTAPARPNPKAPCNARSRRRNSLAAPDVCHAHQAASFALPV